MQPPDTAAARAVGVLGLRADERGKGDEHRYAQRAVDAFNRGNAYMHKQMYDKAVADYTKANSVTDGIHAAALVDRVDHQPPDRGEPASAIRVQIEHVEAAQVTW